MSISVHKLTKFYGDQKALDEVSFEVKKGEIAGFLGPNGAGKSTCMKILSTALYPNNGEALINGYNVLDKPDQVRKVLGYLPEQNPLYGEMYVREYLVFMAKIHKIRNDIKQKTAEIIEKCALGPESHKKIAALSKGYKQRVGLAQALLHDPDVLILDEPTSGLDPNQIIEIRNLIREIGKDKSVLLSSHIMQEVQAICDKVIIIDKGKIVADKKTRELLDEKTEIQYLSVEFKDIVDPKVFESLEFIEEVRVKNNKTLIFSSKNEKIREKIFEHAVKNKLVITEMSGKRDDLELVFHRLTSNK